jgi:predicted aspartyl protease
MVQSNTYGTDDEQVAVEFQTQEDVEFAMRLQAQEISQQQQRQQQQQSRQQNHPSSSSNDLETPSAELMLFVPCEIDGNFVQLFVDCGASISAISQCMVQQLGLQNKVNRAVAGTAVGTGSASIVGMLENVACTIGHVEFMMRFIVLDTPRPTLLLGLDQLRRFKCVINLDDNTLTFGGKDGVSVEFLSPELAAQAAAESFTPRSTASSASRVPGFLRPFLGL